jgi:hypothetical protein
MTWVKSFLDALQTVATSPYAFVAYVCLLAGFIYWLVSEIRLKAIARLPAEEQAAVLNKEYNVFPRSGLSGDEWIRSRRQTLTFWAFVVLIVAVVLLSTIGLLNVKPTTPLEVKPTTPTEVKPTTPTETPAGTTATNSPSTVNTVTTPTSGHGGTSAVVVPPLGIPPIVKGGAPVATKFQNRYLKNNIECVGETVKVSVTEWEERNSSDSPASCNVDAVIFKYTERESNDPQHFLLYEEGRNLFARLPNIPVGQTGPSDWRQLPSQTWNAGRQLTRVN